MQLLKQNKIPKGMKQFPGYTGGKVKCGPVGLECYCLYKKKETLEGYIKTNTSSYLVGKGRKGWSRLG